MKGIHSKKQKVVLNKQTKSTLKISSHVPMLPNLNVRKMSPIKNSLESKILLKPKGAIQREEFQKTSPDNIENNENDVRMRSKTCQAQNLSPINEISCGISVLNLSNTNVNPKSSSKLKITKRQQPNNEPINTEVSSSDKQIKNKNEKSKSLRLIKRKTFSFSTQPKKVASDRFTICSLINQKICVKQKASIDKEDEVGCKHLKQKESTSTKQQNLQQGLELKLTQKINELNAMIEMKLKIREEQQSKIMEGEQKINRLKSNIEQLQRQASKYIDCKKQSIQMKQELEHFIEHQPSQILKEQVNGYKKSQQLLFDLASMLEFSTYEGMLQHLYQQIQIPQQSLYYMIEDFQIGGMHEGSQDQINNFKQKLNEIYKHIMDKIREILRLKSQKIQLFVKTLRQLASYTIDEINTRMVDLRVLSDAYLLQIEPLLLQYPESLERVKSVVVDMINCYNEAQVFY